MHDVIERLGSMRVAIALFVVLALASVIGTVLAQDAAYADYVRQFGPFWAEIFLALGLNSVYGAWWFVLILALLVASILVCVARRMRVTALHARQVGYLLAHVAIVLICVGGWLDSSAPVSMQAWLLDKTPAQRDDAADLMAQRHRLPASNPSFHGHLWIAPGQTVSTATLRHATGLFVQDLPFSLRLNRFTVQEDATGMPRHFASDIVVIDPRNGQQISAQVQVNQPFAYRGVSIYQSGFQDGGSPLRITVWPLTGASAQGAPLNGVVGDTLPLPAKLAGAAAQTIELTGLRAPRASDSSMGPSMQYALRDASGQAREYESYRQPVNMNGALMFVIGVRENPADAFRYLLIPADSHGTLREWMQLRAALASPALRAKAASRFAARSASGSPRELRQRMQQSAARMLAIFAGDPAWASAQPGAQPQGGFQAVATFIHQTVPRPDQPKAARLFWQMLNGTTWELWQLSREQAGEAPAPDNAHTQRFVADAMNAMSDNFLYGMPVYCQLDAFTQVQASVLQVTRAPGKNLVYPGCALLVMGLFMMLWRRPSRGPWASAGLLIAGVAALSALAVLLYHGQLGRGDSVFLLRYFLSSQSAILWMSALFLLATLCYWAGFGARGSAARATGSGFTWAAVLMGLTGMMVRWHESYLMGAGMGHIPLSNLYEALVLFCLVTAWIYLHYEQRYRTRALGAFVLPVICAAVIFLLWYALSHGAQQIQPLVPALQSAWMKLHVPASFIGYGCFVFAAMAGAAWLLAARGRLAGRLPAPDVLDDVMYRAIAIGFAFFTLATILGALWAQQAWGRYWSWDPKETWALIVWLNYAAWLHMRRVRGWRGTVTAWWALAGLIVTAFAFLGVNLFLSGLHSYGGL